MRAPAHTTLSVQQFLTKTGMTSVPTLPTHRMKKVLKGKCFADVEEVKQKTAEASKLMCSKPVLSSGKNISIGVLHQMESASKVTEV